MAEYIVSKSDVIRNRINSFLIEFRYEQGIIQTNECSTYLFSSFSFIFSYACIAYYCFVFRFF
jgi:hypothetical protein